VSNQIDKLGPKDFITGCLVIIIAVFVVPILVLLFKVSIYLAIVIGVFLAIILGVALLGKVVRLIFFRGRSEDKDNSKHIE
jgi:cobalamin biosynthesis protein CobD/CbiB